MQTGQAGFEGGAGGYPGGPVDHRADRRAGRAGFSRPAVFERHPEVLHRVPQGGSPQRP